MQKALFLDRDGVVNKEKNYLYKKEDFEFVEGIFEALHTLQTNYGYKIFIITNQSGIARRYYTTEQFLELTEWMVQIFASHGVEICEVQFCPHAPDEPCKCRKPSPYMIEQMAQKYQINLQNSWMIGDKYIDIEAGLNATIPQANTIQVRSGHHFDESCSPARYILDSIKDAPLVILS